MIDKTATSNRMIKSGSLEDRMQTEKPRKEELVKSGGLVVTGLNKLNEGNKNADQTRSGFN